MTHYYLQMLYRGKRLSSPPVRRRSLAARSIFTFPGFAAAVLGLTLILSAACSMVEKRPAAATRSPHTALPVNQVVAPIGIQVELPGLRPQVLALSPDGRLLVTSGKTHELVAVEPATGEIRQRVPLPPEPPDVTKPRPPSENIQVADEKGQVSYTGLAFSPDGGRLYLSNVNGSIKVFGVGPDGTIAGLFSILLPSADAPRRKEEIPAGLAVSPDGKRLYAALNLSNRLAEIDAASGALLRLFDVAVAPYDVVLVGEKAYVSNWGGRQPQVGDVTGPAGRGTLVKVDPTTYIANEGSVSVVNLESGKTQAEVLVKISSPLLRSEKVTFIVTDIGESPSNTYTVLRDSIYVSVKAFGLHTVVIRE